VEAGQRPLPFFYRNVLDCVRYLLRLIPYCDDLVYASRREYDQSGQSIYAERHMAAWWWEVQVLRRCLFYMKHINRSQETLPEGATLVQIIAMSDQTNLTNFSGDKKAWPVYMTIRNLPSTIRNGPGSTAIVLLG